VLSWDTRLAFTSGSSYLLFLNYGDAYASKNASLYGSKTDSLRQSI